MGVVAALASTSIALAADPESGSIGKASPKVEWKGQVINSGVTNNAWAQDASAPCEPPACDTFALKVTDPGDVTLRLSGFKENTAGGDPGCGIRVTLPDGSHQYTSGTCGPKTAMVVKMKNAKAGDYVVDVADSHVVGTPEDYVASAEMPAFLNAGGSTQPAPAPAPAPAPTQPASAPQLTVSAPKASARKTAKSRKYTVTASTSGGALTQVQGRLLKGRKALGTGKLARLEGTAKLVLKLSKKTAKKLRKGTYTVTVTGVDASNQRVTTTVKATLKK